MSEVAPPDNVLAPIEGLVGSIPFCNTVLGRTAVFSAAGGAVAYFVRPSFAFYPDGRPREWIVLDSTNPEATIFPYCAFVLVPGLLFGVFI